MKLEQARKLKVGDAVRLREYYNRNTIVGTISKVESTSHTVWVDITTNKGTVVRNQWYGNLRRTLDYPRKAVRGTEEYEKVHQFMRLARRGHAARTHRGPKKTEDEKKPNFYHPHSY